MSIINFSQQLARLSAQVQKNTQDLHELRNAVEGTTGPMDQLIEQAERAGSAVADINGVMVEMVSLNQDNWQPALQGVVWQLYEVQKAASETKAVSRDLLDQIVPLIDKHMPQFSLWLKKLLQDAADGTIPTLDELQKKIDDFASSVGVTQLNSMFHNDVPGFIIAFRKLMKEIQDGKKPMSDAAAFLDTMKDKAEDATKAVKETLNTTSGMSTGSKGGSLSTESSGIGGSRNADEQAARMIASIDKAARR